MNYSPAKLGLVILMVTFTLSMLVIILRKDINQTAYNNWMKTCTMTRTSNYNVSLEQALQHCRASKEWLDKQDKNGWK